MDFGRNNQNNPWSGLSYELKNRALYLQQKQTLDLFLERGAISQAITVGFVKRDRGVVVHRVRVEPRKPVSSGGCHFLKPLQSP